MEESHAFCKWLLGGCGFAILGLAGTCWKLFAMYRGELLTRIERAENVAGLLEGLHETKHEDS